MVEGPAFGAGAAFVVGIGFGAGVGFERNWRVAEGSGAGGCCSSSSSSSSPSESEGKEDSSESHADSLILSRDCVFDRVMGIVLGWRRVLKCERSPALYKGRR